MPQAPGVSRGQALGLFGQRDDKSSALWNHVPESSSLFGLITTQPPNLGKTERTLER